MKKKITFLIIMTFLLIKIPSVFALDINIKEIDVYDKNDTISVSNVLSDGLEIIPKVTFNKVNDYVTFKVVFKGKDIEKYKIKSIKDNNTSEYIKIIYSNKEYLTDPVFILLEYYKESNKDVKVDDINIIITLEDENGNNEEVVINNNDKSKEEVSDSAQTGTLSHILTPIILIIITVILIRHYAKYKDIGTMIILLLLVIPLTVSAAGSIKLALTISAKSIKIKGTDTESSTEYIVYLYPNGGTGIKEGQEFKYTETTTFDKFPKVTKTNCTLDGWNVDSPTGQEYYTDVESKDNGKKLYARWNCVSNLTIKTTTGAKNTLNEPIEQFLAKHNDTLTNYNNYIKQSVQNAGYGTSNGVVAAAVSMISYLYDKHNTKLPYYWGGRSNTIGLPSKIGSYLPSTPSDYSGTVYYHFSFDCSGFIRWAILNGGFNFSESKTFAGTFSGCDITDSSCIGEPGDVLDTATHIVLIISVDKANNKYYVAESNDNGVVIQTRGLHDKVGNKQTTVRKLQSFYKDTSNLR